jgi:aerobic-type carbon monoxide dehydrogenase small subunit (CoxS/CutS family)
MILRAVGLLHSNPRPSEADIIHGMEENFCRCGAHPRIVQAIQTAAAVMRGDR